MKHADPNAESQIRLPHSAEGTECVWQEFWKLGGAHSNRAVIRARVTLAQPGSDKLQFAVDTGNGHHFLVDDAAGATGPKPVELVAAALAGCTAFDVITILRKKKHQHVTGYEVRVEAEQAERPPQVFVAVHIHHIVSGPDIDPVAVSEAIAISEGKYCSVEAMLKHTATITTTFEVVEDHVAEPAPAISASATAST